MQASECSYRSAISHYARSVTMRSDGLDVSSVCAPSMAASAWWLPCAFDRVSLRRMLPALRCAPTPTSSSACRPRRCSQRRSVQSLSGTQACTCVRARVPMRACAHMPGCARARVPACARARVRESETVCKRKTWRMHHTYQTRIVRKMHGMARGMRQCNMHITRRCS